MLNIVEALEKLRQDNYAVEYELPVNKDGALKTEAFVISTPGLLRYFRNQALPVH